MRIVLIVVLTMCQSALAQVGVRPVPARPAAQLLQTDAVPRAPSIVDRLQVLTQAPATPGLEPPVQPMLRIEPDAHTGLITKAVVNHGQTLIVTCSQDKTARVWSLRTGALLRVMRVPIDDGNDGRITALAISPDGKTIALSGWTGWNWDGAVSIYIFDVDSGRMIHRLQGLPNAVQDLIYSPDGHYLAVAMLDRNGVRVYRTRDYKLQAQDERYNDHAMNLDFDAAGRLAAASLDGFVRLYDREFRLVARRKVTNGTQANLVRFSPDGRLVAVGMHDTPSVAVLSGEDLSVAYLPDVSGLKDVSNLPLVAWSQDGRILYAAGDYMAPRPTPIFYWTASGKGTRQFIFATEQRIGDIVPLRGTEILVTTEDPAIGVFDIKGGVRWISRNANALFAGMEGELRVSQDGMGVEFSYATPEKRSARFRLDQQSLEIDPALRTRFPAPSTGAAGLSVTEWKAGKSPRLNGAALSLDQHEISRSLAIAPDRSGVLLGTEWALRYFDRNGKQQWMVPFNTTVWAVNWSGDGRFAVAAAGDGTIRWFSAKTGRPVGSLFVHTNERDWVYWTSNGYYVSSPTGDRVFGWHINQGKEHAGEFIRAVQFDRVLYRPDYVLSFLKTGGDTQAAQNEAGIEKLFDVSNIRANAPPRVAIQEVGQPRVTDRGAMARIRFSAQRAGTRSMRDFNVYVNNLPVIPAEERALRAVEGESMLRDIEVPLFAQENIIRIEVFDGTTVGATETFVSLPASPPEVPGGKLYVIAIGVNAFEKLESSDLEFAARDAEVIASALQVHGERLGKSVQKHIVADGQPTAPLKANILQALELIKQTRAEDTVVVFLASHGISDQQGNYYLVPRDAARADIENVIAGTRQAVARGTGSLVSGEALFEAMRMAAGRRLLILDTCHARRIQGRFDLNSFTKRSASSRFSVMVASQGGEQSQEYWPAKHGLFTYGLLQAISGNATRPKDPFVRLDEAFDFAFHFVRKNADPKLGQQTPSLSAPAELLSMPLGARQ